MYPSRKVKAQWDEKNVELFLDICIAEVKARNLTRTHFSKKGWKNVISNFSAAVGTPYEYKQLKNKLDNLKKEYSLWVSLVGKESSLGWDPKKKNVAATDDWWDKKLLEIPTASKFRYHGIDNLPRLEFLFKAITANATNEKACAPSSSGVIRTFDEPTPIQLTQDTVEGSADSFATFSSSCDDSPIHANQDKGKKRASGRLYEKTEKKQARSRKVKAHWDGKNVELFLDICIAEMKAGNINHSRFSKKGWKNVISKFSAAVGTPYNYKQLKNKRDNLKQEYNLWLSVVGKETGLDWDPMKKTVDASDDWWDKKLQEIPRASRFRYHGIDNLPKLEMLFKGSSGTHEKAWKLSSSHLPRGVIGIYEEPTSTQAIQDMVDGSADSLATLPDSSSDTPSYAIQDKAKKRCDRLNEEKGKKQDRPLTTSSQHVERMCVLVETRPTHNVAIDAIELLDSMDEIETGSVLYFKAVNLFLRRECRDIFIALKTNELRAAWLRSYFEQS